MSVPLLKQSNWKTKLELTFERETANPTPPCPSMWMDLNSDDLDVAVVEIWREMKMAVDE